MIIFYRRHVPKHLSYALIETDFQSKRSLDRMGTQVKLENAISASFLQDEYAILQERALFIGVHFDTENTLNHDIVVLLFKDMGSWELAINRTEDAFHFLYRHIERHSKQLYGLQGDPYYKEYIITTVNAGLTLPVKPQYSLRDVEREKGIRKGESRISSFHKMRDWLDRLPVSGTSKRVFLETDAMRNFPIQKGSTRNKGKEIKYAFQTFQKMLEEKGQRFHVIGWNLSDLDQDHYRQAFISMLVSMAYGRWKSKDKSGVNDFLKLIADHDGTYWLLDYEQLTR